MTALTRHYLQYVPMFHHLAFGIHTENIDTRSVFIFVGRPFLMTVQDHEITFGNDAFEVHPFARIIPRHALEIRNKGLLAVGYLRVVLGVSCTGIVFHRLGRFALIKHQIIKSQDIVLVARKRFVAHVDPFIVL